MNTPDKSGLEVIQCGAVSNAWDRTDTELARIIANRQGWLTSGEAIHDGAGNRIARSIEDVAAVMSELQWFMSARHLYWSTIQRSDDPAAAIRNRLDDRGRHPSLVDD